MRQDCERLSGRRPRVVTQAAAGRSIVLGTLPALSAAAMPATPPRPLGPEDFWITEHPGGSLLVAGLTARGVLYGAFALVRRSPSIRRRDSMRARRARPRRSAGSTSGTTSTARSSAATAAARSSSTNGAVAGDLSPRARLRAAAGVGRHQRLLDQQRQRQPARADARVPAAARARRRRVPAVGRPRSPWRSTSAARSARRARDLRPARSARRRVLEGTASTPSTRAVPDLAASCSRPIPKGGSGRRPTGARTPTRPT